MIDDLEQAEQRPHISVAPQIRAYATANGLDLKTDDLRFVEGALNSVAVIENGTVTFGLGDGQTGTVEQALHGLTVGIPHSMKSPEQPRTAPAGSATARAIARNRAERDGRSASTIAAITSGANPWAQATWNRTHQALITNADPTKAAQLRTQAGRP